MPTPYQCDTTVYDCVPGGAYVRSEQSGGNFVWHGTGTILVYEGNTPYYMTHAHGFGDCDDWLWGRELRQGWGSSNSVGTINHWDWSQDWVLVDQSGNKDGLDNRVIPDNNTTSGHVTESGVEYMRDTDIPSRKYGSRTCYSAGEVDRINTWSGPNCSPDHEDYVEEDSKYVVTKGKSKPGDSGSPNYRTFHGLNHNSMVGMIAAGDDEEWWASAAFSINDHDEYDIEFGDMDNTC